MSKIQKPKIISLVGLTASGKSAIGIQLAQQFNGEIISCDSRQIYKGLDIGTAKVTKEEQKLVPHHLLDVVEAGGEFNVFDFQKLAYKTIDDILRRGKLPILVGGTGLYSRSIVQGYSFERAATAGTPRYDVLQICLMPPKEYIRPLVQQRIDNRLKQGMIEETRELLEQGVSREWLKSLGLEYLWNVLYIEGNVTLDEYRKQLATKTMQYAKRQRTWFKKEKNAVYLTEPETFLQQCLERVDKFIKHC